MFQEFGPTMSPDNLWGTSLLKSILATYAMVCTWKLVS